MKEIESPIALRDRLVQLFPPFGIELQGEHIDSYHQVIGRLAPVVTGYLAGCSQRTVEMFCELVDLMVGMGGEAENAICTCLLEHASQIKVAKIIHPHLGAAARREMR